MDRVKKKSRSLVNIFIYFLTSKMIDEMKNEF